MSDDPAGDAHRADREARPPAPPSDPSNDIPQGATARGDGNGRGAGPSDDPFGPPVEACECYCLHCRRTFMSSGIWFQRIRNAGPGKLDGFWMCPTPNCDGKGFTFDIFPTDPDHPANEGWYDDDTEDAADGGDEEWGEEFGDDDIPGSGAAEPQYDPDEPKWKALDNALGGDAGDDDDDIEGEEWKFGLQPGEPLPEPDWLIQSRRARETEEARYDAPDERPREIDWEYGEDFKDDDIPF